MAFCLSIGNIHNKYKYILIGALFAFLTNIIFGYIYTDNMDILIIINTDFEKKMSNHIIFHYIFRFLGILLISFIKFKLDQRASKVSKNSLKSESTITSDLSGKSQINYIYKDIKKQVRANLEVPMRIIVITIAILVIETILEDIYYKSILKRLDFWMFELPIVTYINYKIFHMKVYRHHKLAIYINLIFSTTYGIISLILCTIYTSDENNVYYQYNKNNYFIPIGIIFYLLIIIPRAYSLCQIKYLMDLKYISPHKILMLYGILGTIISSIVGIISSFIKCNKSSIEIKICNISNYKNQTYFENIYLYWEDRKEIKDFLIELINFMVGIITNYFYYFYYILVIKYFTPMHIIFFNILYTFGFRLIRIFNLIRYRKKPEVEVNNIIKVIEIFGFLNFLLVSFGLLVYLEMIVLNFCKLNYNLRENIMERSVKEYELDKAGEYAGLINFEEEEDDSYINQERNDSNHSNSENDNN